MGYAVPAVSDKTSHGKQVVADFHKMAEKRFSEVNENEKDQIVYSAIPKNTQKRRSLGWVLLMVNKKA